MNPVFSNIAVTGGQDDQALVWNTQEGSIYFQCRGIHKFSHYTKFSEKGVFGLLNVYISLFDLNRAFLYYDYRNEMLNLKKTLWQVYQINVTCNLKNEVHMYYTNFYLTIIISFWCVILMLQSIITAQCNMSN